MASLSIQLTVWTIVISESVLFRHELYAMVMRRRETVDICTDIESAAI